MLEPWILCHLNSFGTGKQTPEDSRFWPLSNFDEGQLLLTLKDRTGPSPDLRRSTLSDRDAFKGGHCGLSTMGHDGRR